MAPQWLTLSPAIVAGAAAAPRPADAAPGLPVKPMAELEKDAIKAALAKTDGNRTHAAELLGISRRALVYKLKRMGINPAPGAREQASPGGDAEGVS